jgi:hypothetical protein
MGIHEIDGLSECLFSNYGIWIEQQHVLAYRLPDGNIVGAGEPEIVIVGYQTNPGILLANSLYGIILRGIIDNKHLGLDTLGGLMYTIQALLNEATDIIADYNDRKFHSSVVSAMQRLILG